MLYLYFFIDPLVQIWVVNSQISLILPELFYLPVSLALVLSLKATVC